MRCNSIQHATTVFIQPALSGFIIQFGSLDTQLSALVLSPPQCILLLVHHFLSSLVSEQQQQKKSLVAWSFLSDFQDQKQEINFVWPQFLLKHWHSSWKCKIISSIHKKELALHCSYTPQTVVIFGTRNGGIVHISCFFHYPFHVQLREVVHKVYKLFFEYSLHSVSTVAIGFVV